MSVPKLRFKNFSQALINGPFEHYIKSSKYGPRFDANDYDLNGNVKTIRGTDVALDATIKYEQVPIANLPQKLIDEHQLHEGDILMITTADCGLSAVFEKQEIPFIASAYAVRIVLKNSLDSLWVKYYLQTQHIVNEVNKYVRKGTLSNLPLSDISKFSFTVPALEEQTKIATFLSAVDEKISQLTQKHELLSQYKQGMMQKLFSQQIRFKADDGSEFGEWEDSKLGELTTVITKGTTPSSLGEKFEESGINFIKIESLSSNGKFLLDKFAYIDENTHNKLARSKLEHDDILFSIAGALGRVAIISRDYLPANTNQALAIIRLKDKKITRYIYYFLNSDYVKKIIDAESVQLAQANFSLGQLANLDVLVPCLEEQTKISNFLSSIDQKIEVVAQQIEQAKQWKKGLLQQMFV